MMAVGSLAIPLAALAASAPSLTPPGLALAPPRPWPPSNALASAPWRDLASPLNQRAWVYEALGQDDQRLSLPRRLSLLRHFEAPHRNRIGSLSSVDGLERFLPQSPRLRWSRDGRAPVASPSALGPSAAPLPLDRFLRFDAPRRLPRLPLPFLPVMAPTAPVSAPFEAAPTCPAWQRPRTIRFIRFGTEAESFRLLDCGGGVAAEAIDRLSVLARPPGIPRPALPLPVEPVTAASTGDGPALAEGEWVPGVRLLDPRLLWALQQLAQKFRWRTFYIVSGYRRHDHGNHHHGRAIDLKIIGVDNAEVFKACRRLRDVGCGFYPNSRFVHVDVRPYGSGHPFWIDTAAPGEPSRYVDGWPGVVDSGGLQYSGER